MKFICQESAIQELQILAESNKHSILIEGPEGCGKTYLASEFARMLNVPDVQFIEPTVNSIRECIQTCMNLNSPVVICIENLDAAVLAASYTLLKFLEEPAPNIYILITCRKITSVPDTIISRCVCLSTCPPIDVDLSTYAQEKYSQEFAALKNTLLWKCVRTFTDIDIIMRMKDDQIHYFESLSDITSFRDSVSNIVWRLGHYSDNSETPIHLVVRYISELCNNAHIRRCAIKCIQDISFSRIASHASITWFVFECKYCE